MSGTKVVIKHGVGKPVAGSLGKAELAVDLDSMELWTAATEGGDPQKVAYGITGSNHTHEEIGDNKTQIDINTGDIADNAAQIEINKGDIADNAAQIEINKGNIADNAAQIEINKDGIADNKLNIEANAGDIADTNDRLDKLALNDLTDVDAALPNRLDYLVFNGTDWESEPIALIDTELTYQGAIDMTGAAPASPANGDLYINDTDGVVDASWGVIGGIKVSAGNVVGWADKTSRWYLMGDIASGSVTNVQGGAGIIVDDSVPSTPVVSLDKTETDKWYEPKFAKLTAFNKNFGTTAGTVSEGDHLHSGYEPKFDKSTAFNKNFGTTAGTVAEGNHVHSQYVGIGSGGTVAAPKIVVGATGTDPNTLYFVV